MTCKGFAKSVKHKTQSLKQFSHPKPQHSYPSPLWCIVQYSGLTYLNMNARPLYSSCSSRSSGRFSSSNPKLRPLQMLGYVSIHASTRDPEGFRRAIPSVARSSPGLILPSFTRLLISHDPAIPSIPNATQI